MVRRAGRLLTLVLILGAVMALTRYLSGIASPGYTVIVPCLLLGMAIILGGCELFANGVEHLGSRMRMSHATVGSLLAGVGTALPETFVPVLALLFGRAEHRQAIAVGAILGAPFMLSTLAMAFLGIAVLAHKKAKGQKRPEASLHVNAKALGFELKYILSVMALIFLVSLSGVRSLRLACAAVLVLSYAVFVKRSLAHEAAEGEEFTEEFYFGRFLGYPKKTASVVLQVLAGLFFIVAGAYMFVGYISLLALKSGVPPIVLSLLIAPLATELPEKFNSITWALRGKDTLAMGNITGAMVFQSALPVSIGLLFTDWALGFTQMLNIMAVVVMCGVLLMALRVKKDAVPAWALLTGGLLYAAYVAVLFLAP
jgi:cation:H+ antiporter